jgi:tRNA nucleotidyltransferase/poly(A) polymerase
VKDSSRVHFHISDFPVERAVQIPGLLDHEKEALRRAAGQQLFRIHGFFYSPTRDTFQDPLDSYRQLREGILQTVHPLEESLRHHPDVALQAAKLFSETGFRIDEPLGRFLSEQEPPSIYERPSARIVSDFIDTITTKRADRALMLLDTWSILERLVPEVHRLKMVVHDKDHHPEGDAFNHTMSCLRCVKQPNPNLMLAILLHDTGKATTKSDGSGFRFPKHSKESRRIADRVIRRFGIDDHDRDEILYLVQNHMMLNGIERRPESFQARFFSSPYFPNLLELYRADVESTYTPVNNYYRIARLYRRTMKKQRFHEQGVYG